MELQVLDEKSLELVNGGSEYESIWGYVGYGIGYVVGSVENFFEGIDEVEMYANNTDAIRF